MKLSVLAAAGVLSLGLLAAPPPATAGAELAAVAAPVQAHQVAAAKKKARVVKKRTRKAIKSLPGAKETRSGYSRSKFKHWTDANSNCRDTRAEVLVAESTRKVTGRCHISTGRWVSWYDGRIHTSASSLDVDHMVPLAEAWDSGAKKWNAKTRERFANDLRDGRTLVAVTNSVNRSKSDRDPADWLPAAKKCRYVQHWTAVKVRWGLTVDKRERRALLRVAKGKCGKSMLRVKKATVTKKSSGGKKGGGKNGLDPRFDYCYQAIAAGYGPYYRGRDPEYRWYRDADGDGIVCE